MKDGFVKVACATPDIKVADVYHNAGEIIKLILSAAKNGAKLIVFPELCITSYTCGDLFLQDTLLENAKKALGEIARETSQADIVSVVGLPLAYGSDLYNCAAVLNKGKIKGFVPKTYIPNYGEFYEARHFSPGQEELKYISADEFFENRSTQDLESVQADDMMIPMSTRLLFRAENMPLFVLGIEICEDLWSPEPPSGTLARSGAAIIANLSASDELIGKSEYRAMLIKSQSARLFSAYLYADAGFGESTTDMVFAGDNIIAENGKIIARSKRFENECVYSEIDLERLMNERRRTTTFTSLKECAIISVEFEKDDTELTREIEQRPFVPSDEKMRDMRCEEILTIQAMGLKKRLAHTGAASAVIGVSGGLDSTLALLVCIRAFDSLDIPRKNITAVTMPCFGTTERTKGNAMKFADSLGVTLEEIDIAQAVGVHFRDIKHDPEKYDITYENSQARERTQILMDIANQRNALVIGTGDLSELALGWATYNGDHMSMYGVNAGVPKTLIRYLVDYEAKRTNNKELKNTLIDILNTPVSPELLPPEDGKISQKTEHIVGPYELHDFFLYYMLRYGCRPSKILRLALYAFKNVYDREVILSWMKVFYRRFFSQQFKRSCLPDSPKVGSVALSPRGDWRMPSDASVRIWMDEAERL